jgi:hypothetical protein
MKIHAGHVNTRRRGEPDRPPRPVAAALPYVVLVPPAALGAALAGLIDWPLAAALAGAALAAALVRAAVEQVRKARERNWADAWLLGMAWRRPPTAVLDARREELVSDRQRRMLAGSLRHLVRESRRFALPGASPANFRAVFAHAENLEALAARLEAPAPVSARGVALGFRLLTNPDGPLYDRRKAGELGEAADRIVCALDAGDR